MTVDFKNVLAAFVSHQRISGLALLKSSGSMRYPSVMEYLANMLHSVSMGSDKGFVFFTATYMMNVTALKLGTRFLTL